jgi:hypothetical protein
VEDPDGANQSFAPVPGDGTVAVTFGTPQLTVDPAVGIDGFATEVCGYGFVPATLATLSWTKGIPFTTLVPVSSSGTFCASMLVLPGDVLGPRQVLATPSGGPGAAARYLVEAGPLAPKDSSGDPVDRS